MKRLAPILPGLSLCLLACLGARPAASAPEGVRLLGAAGATIRFEVNVGSPKLAPIGGDGAVQPMLDHHVLEAPAGEPALPSRTVLVAVPPTGEVRVRAVGSDADVREGVLVAPAPFAEREDRTNTPLFRRLPSAYASRESRAPERAKLLGVSWLRDQRVARIQLEPVDYVPAARRLTTWRRLDVEVTVERAGALTAGPPRRVDAFEGVYREALVNYEQGRTWRRSSVLAGGLRRADPAAIAALPAVPETSVYVGRSWVKIAIPKTGFYKLDFGQVRQLAMFNQDTNTRFEDLHLFTWPGVPLLPERDYCDTCGYREVAVGRVDDGDGLFNTNSDAIYFFAMGPSDWSSQFDSTRADTVFLNHPYETKNYYYLTRATVDAPFPGTAKTIEVRNVSPTFDGDEVVPQTFPARVHHEQDAEYWPDASPSAHRTTGQYFWEKWFWRSFTMGNQFSQPALATPGIDTSQALRMRARMWGLSNNDLPPPGYTKSIADHFLDVSINGVAFPRRVFDSYHGQTFDTTLVGSGVRPEFQSFLAQIPVMTDPTNPTRVDRVGAAWVDFFYQRRFTPVGDSLAFDSPPTPARTIYRIGPFTSATPPRVFDVTNPIAPIELIGFQYADSIGYGQQLVFEVEDAGRRRYRVIQDASIVKRPNSDVFDAPFTSFENLRSRTEHADYLVIYYDGFAASADSLIEWRQEHLSTTPGDRDTTASNGTFFTKAVPISALYDQFSGGRTDPLAIRNFLRAAFFNWNGGRDVSPNGIDPPAFGPGDLAFVTLLGDASFDFKNFLGRAAAGQPGTLLPSYENGYDGAVRRQYASDDYLFNVDNPFEIVPDLFGSRLPVGDPVTAAQVVQGKVLRYERDVPLGEYRNRVMLVADDNEQGDNPDPLGWIHLSQTAVLDSLYTPQHIDRAYVYLHTYPDGPGATKPGAKADLRAHIQEGVAMFNYIGHGSPFKIADESVMLDTDVGTLTNAPRFTMFVAASCDVGKFNDPTVTSLGERLIVSTVGGAVGVISATELAFSNQNADLNRLLYLQLFDRDSTSGQYHMAISEALVRAKYLLPNVGGTNAQKYALMGDAGTRLNLPKLWTEVALEDSAGNPITEIRRGQTVTFRGRVLDAPGGSLVPLDGVAGMLIEDSKPRDEAPGCFGDLCDYDYYAGAMFRGDVAVAGGTYQGRFVVPLEAKEGPRGRTRAYLRGRSPIELVETDGVGSRAMQISPGGPAPGDHDGPRITLSFTGGSTSVRPDAVLRVELFDPSGILTTGHTPQNGIVVTLDDNTTTRVDITSSFRYAADSYQSGTATFQLPNLSPGTHTVKVTAADNLASGLAAAAHRSTATLTFQVVETPPLGISRTYLFPNPTRSGGAGSGGQFVVDAPGDSVNVLVRIYTASGRLIRTLRTFGGLGQTQIPWDGLDDEGAALATGVYFYKVNVNVREADGSSSARQKADADGRIVILGRR